MFQLPAETEDSRSSSFAPLGMAAEIMVQITYRLCRTILRKMFLVTIDAYLKWLEVQVVNADTSHVSIEHL